MTRVKYRHPGASSTVILHPDGVQVIFDKPQRAVTPGQSAVFYDGEVVLGGGIIKKSWNFEM